MALRDCESVQTSAEPCRNGGAFCLDRQREAARGSESVLQNSVLGQRAHLVKALGPSVCVCVCV